VQRKEKNLTSILKKVDLTLTHTKV
jgi:hypothetical protein